MKLVHMFVKWLLILTAMITCVSASAFAQPLCISHPSLEYACISSEFAFRGTVAAFNFNLSDSEMDQVDTLEIVIQIQENLRGELDGQIRSRFDIRSISSTQIDELKAKLRELRDAKTSQTWLALSSKEVRKQAFANDDKSIPDSHFQLRTYFDSSGEWSGLSGLLSMQNNFEPIGDEEELLAAIKRIFNEFPEYELAAPDYASITMPQGPMNDSLLLCGGRLLEEATVRVLKAANGDDYRSRLVLHDSILNLSTFRSPENVQQLKGFLDHPAVRGEDVVTVALANKRQIKSRANIYYVRRAAYKVLINWGVDVKQPELIAPN